MDFRTIWGIMNKQWAIEPGAATHLADLWYRSMAGEIQLTGELARGVKSEDGQQKKVISLAEMHRGLLAQDRVVMAPEGSWGMEDFKGFDGAEVAIIPVSGPMMKSDYCGSFGTDSMRQMVQMASASKTVHTIVMLCDTPGGQVSGTDNLQSAVKNSGKRTICAADMLCSAGYWVGSACDEIVAISRTATIGSIGTMCSFYDSSAYLEKNGIVLREYYATESKDKNRAFNEAKKGDGKMLVRETLDPTNNIFLSTVKANRGDKLSKKENVLTGKTYNAEQAVAFGLADSINSLEGVVQDALAKRGARVPRSTTIAIQNSDKMDINTLAELRSQYPGLVTEAETAARKEGATAERVRIASWMEWQDTDPEAVQKGINEGAQVTAEVVKAMSAKAADKVAKLKLEADNPQPVQPTPGKQETPEDKAVEANKAALLEALGINPKK